MEYLDIRDKNGHPTGVIKERSLFHSDGDMQGTSHVWIVKINEKGSYDLLLQKRSENKDAFPGCYDISSAGHLPAGQDYLTSALRELEEELGIKAEPEQLHFMGLHEGKYEEIFYGKPFKNHEISHVYLYSEPINIEKLKLLAEIFEVSITELLGMECEEDTKRKDEKERIKNYHPGNGRI